MKISFFSPVIFTPSRSNPLFVKERLLSFIERYFIVNHTLGYVVTLSSQQKGSYRVEKAVISQDTKYPRVLAALKIVSYITLLIPLLMLLAKFILRMICCIEQFPEPISRPEIPEPLIFVKPDVLFSRESGGIPGFPYDMALPSAKNPWINTEMPEPKETIMSPISISELDETKLLDDLSSMCEAFGKGKKPDNIESTGEGNGCIYFSMQQYPDFSFIAAKDDFYAPLNESAKGVHTDGQVMHNWYKKTLEVKQHMDSQIGDYTHLRLPQFKLVKVPYNNREEYFVLQERLSSYRTDDSSLVWKNRDVELRKAFQELFSLIDRMGISDGGPDNFVPIMESDGTVCSLACIRVEGRSPDPSFPGALRNGLRTLIHSICSQESLEAIFNKALPKDKPGVQRLIIKQGQILGVMHNHEKYHAKKGNAPYDIPCPINLDEDLLINLGLNLEEETTLDDGTSITMRQAIALFVGYWNQLMTTTSLCHNLDNHYLDHTPLVIERDSSFPKGLSKACSEEIVASNFSALWVRRILNALVEKEIICSWHVSLAAPTDRWDAPLVIWM